MLDLLRYPPVLRGLILLLISGATFPLAGVYILRMNLLPIRYLMMHGVLLGGALGLVLNWDPALTSMAVNLLLVLLLAFSRNRLKTDAGSLTMFLMVATVAAASLIISLFRVPAKDTLVLLWGSLYSSTVMTLVLAVFMAIGLIFFTLFFFRHLTLLFYSSDVARSQGISPEGLEAVLMGLIALVIALSMGLMGALLMDALILLPAILAGFLARGFKGMLLLSSLLGFLFALSGFFISLSLDVPVSSGVAIPAVLIFIVVIVLKRGVMHEKNT